MYSCLKLFFPPYLANTLKVLLGSLSHKIGGLQLSSWPYHRLSMWPQAQRGRSRNKTNLISSLQSLSSSPLQVHTEYFLLPHVGGQRLGLHRHHLWSDSDTLSWGALLTCGAPPYGHSWRLALPVKCLFLQVLISSLSLRTQLLYLCGLALQPAHYNFPIPGLCVPKSLCTNHPRHSYNSLSLNGTISPVVGKGTQTHPFLQVSAQWLYN